VVFRWRRADFGYGSRLGSQLRLHSSVDLLAFRDLTYVPVKGIYVTSSAAGSSTALGKLLALADQTEINAFVIDVKDASGHVTYAADVPLAQKLGLIEPASRTSTASSRPWLSTRSCLSLASSAFLTTFSPVRNRTGHPEQGGRSLGLPRS